MKINFRQARLEDLDELVCIEEKVFNKRKYDLMSRVNFYDLLKRNKSKIILAIHKGKPCGMAVVFLRNNSKYARLYSIAVLPQYQGNNIGKELFARTIQLVKKLGLKGLLLEIRADNKKHLDRYLGLGFKVTRSIDAYYPDKAKAIKLKQIF